MFCKKCGNELAEGVAFCPKCGLRVSDEDGANAVTEKELGDAAWDEGKAFQEFVNAHVRETTGYQSAEELLRSPVKTKFVKICLGIPVLLSLLLAIQSGEPMSFFAGVIVFGLFGWGAAMLAATIKKLKYANKFNGSFTGTVNPDEILEFLNKNLKYLSPYLNEWGYLEKERIATSVKGIMASAWEESVERSLKQIKLCTNFGEKGWRLAVLNLQPSISHADTGEMLFFTEAENRISMLFLSHDWGWEKYKCVVRTAPILQAAMEYYLKFCREKCEAQGKENALS